MKKELRISLEELMPRLAPGVDYSTRQLAAMLGASEDEGEICRALIAAAGRYLGLAARGSPQPGKSWMTGKTVRPWIWRRIDAAPLATILTPPADNATSLIERVADLERRVSQLEGRQ